MTMLMMAMKVMRRSIDGCDDGQEGDVNDVVMTMLAIIVSIPHHGS